MKYTIKYKALDSDNLLSQLETLIMNKADFAIGSHRADKLNVDNLAEYHRVYYAESYPSGEQVDFLFMIIPPTKTVYKERIHPGNKYVKMTKDELRLFDNFGYSIFPYVAQSIGQEIEDWFSNK